MSLDSEAINLSSNNESENEATELTFDDACGKGNLKLVKVYVSQSGFDMNVDGRTGFRLACENGKLNVVQFLVQRGFDMDVVDQYGFTGFHFACMKGHSNVVQFLIQHMHVGTNRGRTGFHLACLYGHLNVVQFLVGQGFNMNTGTHLGWTGFHLACENDKLNVVQFLVQRGFDMYVGTNRGRTGFHLACLYGHLKVIQFLVGQGFNVNTGTHLGRTGLKIMIVLYNRSRTRAIFLSSILFLIETGASLDENDNVSEDLISAIQNRVVEITFMKEKLSQKWTGLIAQVITDFTMDPFTNTSLQNLSQVLD